LTATSAVARALPKCFCNRHRRNRIVARRAGRMAERIGFKGLRARGGFSVDIAWKKGRLVSAMIHSIGGTTAQVRYGNGVTAIKLNPGQSKTISD